MRGDEGGTLDRQLVEAARRGDRDAFEALVRREVAGVYRTSLAILGNPADAEESTQEAFLSAWRSLRSLRDPARFDAWLGRIVVNACRMALRRRRGVREITIEEKTASETSDRAADVAADPAAIAVDALAFDRAFEQLSVDERRLLALTYAEDRPLEEVARLLEVPVGTVKSRLARARDALARALDRSPR
jgi:RNA polymerase sigma-70 factor (ECF subfamily)